MNTKDAEHNGILSDKYNSLYKDYLALKNDYEAAKLETNEAESNLQKLTLESESKINSLKAKNDALKQDLSSGNSELGRKLEALTTKHDDVLRHNQEAKAAWQQSHEELRSALQTRDAEYVELNSRFERESIIYKSKIQHLEDFKQKLSMDLMDSNEKFELAMNHLNSRHAAEREKWERSHDSLLKSVERRHAEQNEQLRSEADRLAKELREREEYFARQKNELQQSNAKLKASETHKFEGKYQELLKENQRLAAELKAQTDKYKSELDSSHSHADS